MVLWLQLQTWDWMKGMSSFWESANTQIKCRWLNGAMEREKTNDVRSLARKRMNFRTFASDQNGFGRICVCVWPRVLNQWNYMDAKRARKPYIIKSDDKSCFSVNLSFSRTLKHTTIVEATLSLHLFYIPSTTRLPHSMCYLMNLLLCASATIISI